MFISQPTLSSPGAGFIGDPVERFVMRIVLYYIPNQPCHKGNKYPEEMRKAYEYGV